MQMLHLGKKPQFLGEVSSPSRCPSLPQPLCTPLAPSQFPVQITSQPPGHPFDSRQGMWILGEGQEWERDGLDPQPEFYTSSAICKLCSVTLSSHLISLSLSTPSHRI